MAWADQSHEDEEEEDDGMQTVSDENSTRGTASTAAASSAATRLPSAFQKRLAELESQVQGDKANLVSMETAAAEQLATHRLETEAGLLNLTEQMSGIRDDMTAGLKAQAKATGALGADLRKATADTAAQFAQLMALLKPASATGGVRQDKRSRSQSADKEMTPNGRHRSPRRGANDV